MRWPRSAWPLSAGIPPALASYCTAYRKAGPLQDPGLLWVTGGSCGDGARGTCCLSCANNMKAFWRGGFPKKHSNLFSKRLQLRVLGHGCCYSDQMLASQKEILFFPPFFYNRHIFISSSDGFANFLRHLLQGGKCWYRTQGLGIQFGLVLGTICSCLASDTDL